MLDSHIINTNSSLQNVAILYNIVLVIKHKEYTMKYLIILLLISTISNIFADSYDNHLQNQYIQQDNAGSKIYYGNDGSYQGNSINGSSGTRYYYNKNGQMSGWTQQTQGGTTFYYDSNGKITSFSN